MMCSKLFPSETGYYIIQPDIDFICVGCSQSEWLSLDNWCDYDDGAHVNKIMSCIMRKTTMWILNRSDKNRAVQAQKLARGWKFGLLESRRVIILLSSENKGADLLLCFLISKMLDFS